MGDLGKIVPMEFDLRDEESIRQCVRHSDVVYNLIGRNFEYILLKKEQKTLNLISIITRLKKLQRFARKNTLKN